MIDVSGCASTAQSAMVTSPTSIVVAVVAIVMRPTTVAIVAAPAIVIGTPAIPTGIPATIPATVPAGAPCIAPRGVPTIVIPGIIPGIVPTRVPTIAPSRTIIGITAVKDDGDVGGVGSVKVQFYQLAIGTANHNVGVVETLQTTGVGKRAILVEYRRGVGRISIIQAHTIIGAATVVLVDVALVLIVLLHRGAVANRHTASIVNHVHTLRILLHLLHGSYYLRLPVVTIGVDVVIVLSVDHETGAQHEGAHGCDSEFHSLYVIFIKLLCVVHISSSLILFPLDPCTRGKFNLSDCQITNKIAVCDLLLREKMLNRCIFPRHDSSSNN